MVLEYTYDHMCHIIDLFNENKIASFHIKRLPNKTFVMDYMTIDSCPVNEQKKIFKVLENALSERLCAIDNLHAFLEAMCAGKDINFRLDFNAVNVKQCQLHFYLAGFRANVKKGDNILRLQNSLAQLDHVLTDMGIIDTEVSGIYMKNPRGRKYQTPTFAELLKAMRHSLDKSCRK